VFVGRGVGGAVVGAGVGVGGAVVGGGVALGASVVGAAVRITIEIEGDGDVVALALTVGEGVAPARRVGKLVSTPRTTSTSSPPATAASAKSIHRGPRRGGGMSFVVSDMTLCVAPCMPTPARRSRDR
jgi:hypothetical protein